MTSKQPQTACPLRQPDAERRLSRTAAGSRKLADAWQTKNAPERSNEPIRHDLARRILAAILARRLRTPTINDATRNQRAQEPPHYNLPETEGGAVAGGGDGAACWGIRKTGASTRRPVTTVRGRSSSYCQLALIQGGK